MSGPLNQQIKILNLLDEVIKISSLLFHYDLYKNIFEESDFKKGQVFLGYEKEPFKNVLCNSSYMEYNIAGFDYFVYSKSTFHNFWNQIRVVLLLVFVPF